MKNIEIKTPEQSLQRPDLGVESVNPTDQNVQLSKEEFPWLAEDQVELHTVKVRLEDGTEFRYASAVSAHDGIADLAADVPHDRSLSAERGMFKGVAAILQGQTPSSIDTVVRKAVDITPQLYKTAKRGNDVARLFFTVMEDEAGPFVVKLGVASHKKQHKLMAIMNGKPGKGRQIDGKRR